jgi:lycopene cyclase domain-containing protein
VLGITLGWVPLEEYAFFILQPIAVGLWLLCLMRHLTPPSDFKVRPMLRIVSVAGLFLPWLVSLVALLLGWGSMTYLSLILVWSLPPIMLQLGFGADILWHRRRVVLAAILSSTLYLAIADGIAINIGIWTITPETSLEIYLAGVLPIEEFVFFLVTNILIVGGITLLQERQSQLRMVVVVDKMRMYTDPLTPLF